MRSTQNATRPARCKLELAIAARLVGCAEPPRICTEDLQGARPRAGPERCPNRSRRRRRTAPRQRRRRHNEQLVRGEPHRAADVSKLHQVGPVGHGLLAGELLLSDLLIDPGLTSPVPARIARRVSAPPTSARDGGPVAGDQDRKNG
jgi:hypothetical protein